jgi:transposase
VETFRPITDVPAVFAGVDVAKERHQVLIDVPGRKRRSVTIPNSRSGFTDLVRELKRHNLPVHVALEATGDYHRALASFLHQNGIRLHLASSVATARTREALHNSWDKNDPKDAQVILHLLKGGTVQIFHDPFINGYNDLQELANTYYQAGRRKTAIYNTLMTHYLPVYFPEAEAYMCSSRSPWLIRLLVMTPCPSAVLKYSKNAFIKAASAIDHRKYDRVRWLADFYEAAKTSIGVPISEKSTSIAMFRFVLSEYLHTCDIRDRLQTAALERLGGDQDFRRLQTIPGIGPILALTVMAESGDLRRFQHYRQYLRYCGLDLCTDQSGRFRGTSHLSKRGNGRLRYVFWMAGVVAVRMRENSFRAKFERYTSADPKNSDLKRKAYTAVAAKMARVVYGVLKAGVDYRRFHEPAIPSGGTSLTTALEAATTS